MKRVICMLLALVLCLSLPIVAFAATNSPANNGAAPTVPGSIPKTGDAFAMNTWLIIMVLALLALVVAVMFFRKAQKNG